jgi:hypothetical protein
VIGNPFAFHVFPLYSSFLVGLMIVTESLHVSVRNPADPFIKYSRNTWRTGQGTEYSSIPAFQGTGPTADGI